MISQQASCTSASPARRLEPGLYLVLTEPPGGYEQLAESAVSEQLPALQLRYKGEDQRRFLQLARNLRDITRGSQTLFIVNDRPDIALIAGADGVHIGQEDLPATDVRGLIGTKMLLGLSTHNLDQVAAAEQEPVDYIGFGPLYPTTSKQQPDPVTGPALLSEAYRLSSRPIVAIGGLTRARLTALDLRSCHNAAVISEVALADDPKAMMRTLHRSILELKGVDPEQPKADQAND
ncbi:MAG: thiamine phosphate synthase [Desulfobulbaceae bacterium]|nr:thiamine phosphate synthase [Desulfobulbaceae bacterium]